jgi:hypothetical protein
MAPGAIMSQKKASRLLRANNYENNRVALLRAGAAKW